MVSIFNGYRILNMNIWFWFHECSVLCVFSSQNLKYRFSINNWFFSSDTIWMQLLGFWHRNDPLGRVWVHLEALSRFWKFWFFVDFGNSTIYLTMGAHMRAHTCAHVRAQVRARKTWTHSWEYTVNRPTTHTTSDRAWKVTLSYKNRRY